MGGFKHVVLTRAQADQVADRLSKHGIEVIPHDPPVINANQWPFCIKYGTKEIKVLKYYKAGTGDWGIVFFSVDQDDFEFIDMLIALLSQPVADPDSGTEREHNKSSCRSPTFKMHTR